MVVFLAFDQRHLIKISFLNLKQVMRFFGTRLLGKVSVIKIKVNSSTVLSLKR